MADDAPTRSAGRADYDQLVQFRGLDEGEPYFMVRGHDAVGAGTIRAWAMLASAAGAPPALIEQALRQADKLEAWPVKKVANADHLSEAEQKQLIYCLRRRAWDARDDALDIRIFYAEQRAEAAAEGRLARRRARLEAAIDDLAREIRAATREALFETQRRIDDGQKAAGHHQLGLAEGLARASEVIEKLKGALDE